MKSVKSGGRKKSRYGKLLANKERERKDIWYHTEKESVRANAFFHQREEKKNLLPFTPLTLKSLKP